ncbi:hypothetical protein PILCRDRAFT_63658, partial [Piloderma croceum F 1598]
DMEPGSVIFTEGFSLQDAMSVLEIGEPRLDSGITLQEERRPPFNSLLQMLPEEICWILDRSFACEMEWHAGNMLSQTVFTLLYVHHLTDLNPDFIPLGSLHRDQSRSPELITVVLRAAVFGLLKSCDLSWRELVQNNVHDGEDWQSEKCEVSLLESVQVKHVLLSLEDACGWIRSYTVTMPWRDALLARMLLRKTILELMDCGTYRDSAHIHALLTSARAQLRSIRSRPCPVPAPGSNAFLVFDPFVARKLNSFGPLRTHELPSQERVWDALQCFLDDWDEVRLLCGTTSILTWEVLGYLRAWSTRPRQMFPYIRSLTQSAFFNGVLVLNRFSPTWIVEHFFSETLNLSYDTFVRVVKERWRGSAPPPFSELEALIRKNPPRRRRSFMKSLLDWHLLYDSLLNITSHLTPLTDGTLDFISRVSDAALLWRLTIVREVLLSGFQLELYTMEEKAFAYWYVTQVIEEHLCCLDDWIPAVSKESTTYGEMKFQHVFLTALQTMSMTMFSVTALSLSFPLQRLRLNFLRRYKWAFRPSYDAIDSTVVAPPDFFKFLSARQELLAVRDEGFSPSDSFKLARCLLQQLSTSLTGWAGHWSADRLQFVRDLADTCETLYALPSSIRGLREFDLSTLHWEPLTHAWFPFITPRGRDDAGRST